MPNFVPKYMFFTKGCGVAKARLQSFELALRDAGIEKLNIVRVSSIFPPKCRIISKKEGVSRLGAGQVTHCVIAEQATDEPGRLVAASIGLAVPTERAAYGYLSEHHSFGETPQRAGDFAEDLAAVMLASTLGIDFDPESAWDDRKQVFKMSGKIVRTTNITEGAKGDKNGLWTTVVAAAVLLD